MDLNIKKDLLKTYVIKKNLYFKPAITSILENRKNSCVTMNHLKMGHSFIIFILLQEISTVLNQYKILISDSNLTHTLLSFFTISNSNLQMLGKWRNIKEYIHLNIILLLGHWYQAKTGWCSKIIQLLHSKDQNPPLLRLT